MKFLYLDSSVLVSLALYDPVRIQKAQIKMKQFDVLGTNELAIVECQAGLSSQLGNKGVDLTDAEQNLNQILARIYLYKIDSLILGHARSLVKSYRNSLGLRTLDAIHLATANLILQSFNSSTGESHMEYLTADRKQHSAFTTEGYVGSLI